MEQRFLYYGIAYFVLTVVLYFVLRKYWGHKMYPKVVSSALIPVIWAFIAMYFDLLAISPTDAAASVAQKVAWTVLFVLIANAGMQFLTWIVYDFLIGRKWSKLPRFIFNLAGFILVVAVMLAAIRIIFNVQLTGLIVGSTVISAVIGLALQDTLGNLIAGLSLNVESPFNIGDWVNLGGHEGKIISQNWRTLTIRTRNSHRVSLTNKFIAEDKIINYSRPTQRQIHNFYIFLDYAHPPNFVKKVLNEMLDEIPEVDIAPDLGTFVVDFGDSGVKYCLRYWLYDYADILPIQDKVLTRVWYTLRRHDILIPYPISDVRMSVMDPAQAELSKQKEHQLIEESLRSFKWLEALTANQIKELARNAQLKVYSDSARLVRQGDEGDSMFIILDGKVEVRITGARNQEITVKERNAGDFFGEMSLLTGEPRSASVIAVGDVRVIVLNKKAFTTIIMKDPAILESLLDILETQRSDLESIIDADRKKSSRRPKSAREVLLMRIKSYFGLK